jgi:Xaa-Pro aminopeptidase
VSDRPSPTPAPGPASKDEDSKVSSTSRDAGSYADGEAPSASLSEGSDYSIDISSSDRRVDVEAKQSRVAGLLRETGREGLLLLEPENFTWLTAGATPRGHIDPASLPALYCTAEARWLIASNVDSQRLFDEEIEALGFQLKEWPWHWGREQFLADLCTGRKIACDRVPAGIDADFVALNEQLRKARCCLTVYEQACLLALGESLAHALEAACRTLRQNDTEREVAGQLAHRLMHRGVVPVHIGVAADGRSRTYRRFGFTSASIEHCAVLTATARKYGLHATASRTVCFGELPEEMKKEQSAVVRVTASYLASTWPEAVPREVLLAGRRIYQLSGFEHEWLLAPQGHLTGRAAVEALFTPQTTELVQPGWAICWSASAGSSLSCDTYLVTERGPKPVTPPEVWPMKRIRIQGAECIRPDVLIR